jgi:hypothetical protein
MADLGDHHTTVGGDELNVAKAQAEEVIQPHCVAGDMARKAVAAIKGWTFRSFRQPPPPIRTPVAVHLAMPFDAFRAETGPVSRDAAISSFPSATEMCWEIRRNWALSASSPKLQRAVLDNLTRS